MHARNSQGRLGRPFHAQRARNLQNGRYRRERHGSLVETLKGTPSPKEWMNGQKSAP